jgi:cytidylate kinase
MSEGVTASTIHARVVTISATYGAMGSRIGPALAERLGLPFFDRLIHNLDAAGSAGAVVEHLTDAERQQGPPAGLLASLANLTSVLGLPVPSADAEPRGQLRAQVESSVRTIAEGGGGVILGRAAAVVLGATPNAYHVRLTGPPERRLERIQSMESAPTEAEARAQQADTDKAWSRFVSRLFDRDPADPSLYHLVVDTTALPIDTCVDVLATAATAFWG